MDGCSAKEIPFSTSNVEKGKKGRRAKHASKYGIVHGTIKEMTERKTKQAQLSLLPIDETMKEEWNGMEWKGK